MKIFKLIIINLVLISCLLEGGMRLYYHASDSIPPHSDHSIYREWKWVKQRLEDGKADFDQRFVHDRFTGWRNAPGIDTRDKHGNRIRTNHHGMRNVQDFEPGKSKYPRLLILGDSYSFGHAVSNEDTYAHILGEEYLPDWQVMNLAVSATGTDQNYLMYEHYGEKFHPDIVLLGFYVLDFNRNTYSFRDYAKPMFVPMENGELKLTHSPVPAPGELLEAYRSGTRQIGGWHYSYAWAAFGRIVTNRIKRDRSPGSLPRRTLSGIMKKFIDRTRSNNAKPVWVIFPIRDIATEAESKYDVVEEFVLEEAERMGMPALRLQPVFREFMQTNPDIELWNPKEVGGHLSPTGNRVAAEAIHKFLLSEKMLGSSASE